MKKQTISTKSGIIVVTPWTPQQIKAAERQERRVSITTLDRRLQVIRKWQREGLITAAKAKALTDEVLEAL